LTIGLGSVLGVVVGRVMLTAVSIPALILVLAAILLVSAAKGWHHADEQPH
jgi:hypothetical protein